MKCEVTAPMPYIDSETIVWLMFFGICLGAVYAFFTKRFLGGLVRKLIAEKAASESSAMTLAELGYGKVSSAFMKRCLAEGCGLRKYVGVVFPETHGERDLLIHEKTEEQRYFLPYDKYEIAEKRYGDSGTTFGVLVLTVVLFFVVAVISTIVVPFMIKYYRCENRYPGDAMHDARHTESTESVSENAVQNNSADNANNAEKTPDGSSGSKNGADDSSDEEFSMLEPSNNSR